MTDARAEMSHRDRLLRSGAALFYEAGFHGTAVDAVLVDAGVPKGSFYHHFGSKEAFGFVVLDRYDEFQRGILARWAERDDLTVPERLSAYHAELAERFVSSGWNRSCLVGKLSNELASSSESYRVRLAQSLAEWRESLRVLLAVGQTRHEVRQDMPAAELADAVLAMVQGAFVSALVLRDQSFLDASTREIARILSPENDSPEVAHDSRPTPPSEPESSVVGGRRTHRDRLLDKGIELLFERGYHGMTVDALLTAAQVPKGSFYHHFGSKEAFTLAVLDNYAEFHRKTLTAWVSGHDELPTALRLRGYYDELVAIFVASGFRHSDLVGKLATEVAPTSEPLRSALATLIRQWRSQLEVVLADGRLRGDVRADVSIEDRSAALLSLISGAFVVSSSTRDAGALDSVADAIVAVV